jgi:DNA repair protein RecN (Recombination protein N)
LTESGCKVSDDNAMLALLNISNIALIGELQVEFERGLNLLTGETGSGKSIIVDALSLLCGGRFASDMVKSGESWAAVEGLFSIKSNQELEALLDEAGIALEGGQIIIRREVATGGRNKIFINNRLATQSLLRRLRPFLVDIHGQGEHQTLFNPEAHLELLDAYAGLESARQEVAQRHRRWLALRRELDAQLRDEAEKYQLIDILRFQIEELERAGLVPGEDERLEEERRRLMNLEKLKVLCSEGYALLYEDDDSALARVRQAMKRVEELSAYEASFSGYAEGLESARALMEDLAFALRDFADGLGDSPERLAEIENRLAEISRLKRKYGGRIESALEHLAKAKERLRQIERSDEREQELRAELELAQAAYLESARALSRQRALAAKKFERDIRRELKEVAIEDAKFEVMIESSHQQDRFTPRGIDRVEFYFSANVGEATRPLQKVASGGEASRLMLVLKTIANASHFPRTIVFDEIDSGIGGRVSEAVGLKLKKLAKTHQVLCVTHQAQIARFADCHLLVRKEVVGGRTRVRVEKLDQRGRIHEVARMLTGAEITEAALEHAREMLRQAASI